MIESELGRFYCMLSIHSMESHQTNRRIKTAGYRRTICRLATTLSYRETADTFNKDYHRVGTESELSYGTIAGDIEQEGLGLLKTKQQIVSSILEKYGFDPETGLYAGEQFPDAYRNETCELITIDPESFMEGITPGWETADASPAKLAAEEGHEPCAVEGPGKEPEQFSEPDMDVFKAKKKRRGKRFEVPEDQKEVNCISFARWFNQVTRHRYYGIIHACTIEKRASDTVCISIDAVYVDKQAKTRRKSILQSESEETSRPDSEEEKEKRIGHMNIHVEWASSVYYITSIDTTEAFRQMIAVIMNNNLYGKYMIFLTDGELAINDKIQEYCSMWHYHVELDWIHLEHKCYDRLSNAIRAKRMPDPRGEVIYYKRGPKKGQIKSQEYISQSRLYARAVSRILWVGNVDEAISFLEGIDPSVIKNQEELNQLITYLRNKKDWIPCYALRKKAGLKNSSNSVEGQNNMNVSDRQKHNGTSWRPEGSSYLAALKTLFDNGEDQEWFFDGKTGFNLSQKAHA